MNFLSGGGQWPEPRRKHHSLSQWKGNPWLFPSWEKLYCLHIIDPLNASLLPSSPWDWNISRISTQLVPAERWPQYSTVSHSSSNPENTEMWWERQCLWLIVVAGCLRKIPLLRNWLALVHCQERSPLGMTVICDCFLLSVVLRAIIADLLFMDN